MKKREDAPMPERLWSIQETAAFLGLPVQTLYLWRYKGEGPRGYKVGRFVRYNPRDVMLWLEQRAA